MPEQEPALPHLERTARAWARYKRLMTWVVLAALLAAALSLLYLDASGAPLPIHMMVAALAGLGFSVLLGTALMGLVYFSNIHGDDGAATTNRSDDDPR